MYSILPALVSLVFLGYGAYVLGSRGASRAALTFFLVCLTTFSWQFCWAILFQLRDPDQAIVLARIGYTMILFLPTTLYHFVIALTRRRADMAGVHLSYLIATVLVLALFSGTSVIRGVNLTFFGFYPDAGPLHPLHIIQTVAVLARAGWVLYQEQRIAVSTDRVRLRYCLASLSIYCVAAVDYAGNYGVDMYPPGVIFIAISLGIIAQAMARHNLLANPMMLAATVAHELRTPLATIRNQARVLAKGLPELVACYEQAQRDGSRTTAMRPGYLDYLRELGGHIEAEVARSNFITDMVLASANPEVLCKRGFSLQSAEKCVEEALASYPFDSAARAKVVLHKRGDFVFHGSDTLMVYVLYNLIKNALAAVDGVEGGKIEIALQPGRECHSIIVSDTGHGIPEHVLPHVFDPFYTTKSTRGTGMGLAFCKRAINAFGGTIRCRSREGAFTMMAMEFPAG